MATWANTYPGLDAALHEMASVLTSSPTVRDDRVEELAAAVRSYYTNEMSGSSFQFDGWSEPQDSQQSTTPTTTTGEYHETSRPDDPTTPPSRR